ncbi:MAG: hypothetical protein ACYCYF_01520 [Anaerolineae bacterium]
MLHYIRESDVEEATMAWFEGLGYTIRNGPEIGPEADIRECRG